MPECAHRFLEPRRAAVALVLRIVPPANHPLPPASDGPPQPISIQDFFELDWVNAPGARPELLYLRRKKGESSNHSNGASNGAANGKPRVEPKKTTTESHVAFPGGRMEDGDEDGLYTGMLFILDRQ